MNNTSRGSILIFVLVVSAVIMTITVAFFSYLGSAVATERVAEAGAQAQTIAEGGIDKAIYELNNGSSYTGETNTTLGNGEFTVVVTSLPSGMDQIVATGYVPSSSHPTAQKTITVDASINTTTVSFHYGAQVGDGGVNMNNGSQIQGNLFSDGSITGSGTITGDATVASTTGSIDGVTVQGNAWAYALTNCTIDGNATYQTTNTCNVGGTQYPNTTPETALNLPITDAQIAAWEATAESGGTISGNYSISGTQTLGPKKIDGNLTIGNGATLVLSGPIWVVGNVTFSNNATLTVSSGTGSSGAIILADSPGNTATEGVISISNNANISGNGSVGSYPMLVTTSQASQAITLSNNVDSAILYAPYGGVTVVNGATLNEVVAKFLQLNNNATVIYKSGLENASFSNGPGGSWAVEPGTYAIQ